MSHYLFDDRFGRPGKGNDKGKVEGLVGYARRNFLAPVPSFPSFDALNAYLEGGYVKSCVNDQAATFSTFSSTAIPLMYFAPR